MQKSKRKVSRVIDLFTATYSLVPGYVRLHTSLGELNLELHCDLVWPLPLHVLMY